MALDRYLGILSRRKWVLLAPLLLSVLGAIAVSAWMPPVYATSAVARIALAGRTLADGPPVRPEDAERLTNTYVLILESRPILLQVIAELGLSTSPEQLARRIDVESLADTELIRITAEAGSPEEARDVADALALVLVEEGRTFYTGAGSPSVATSFSIVEQAVLPEGPVRPNWPLNIGIGSLLGLAAGIGLSLVLEYTDRTLRGVKDLDEITALPVLSSIPLVKTPAINGAMSLDQAKEGNFAASGEYRLLSANLRRILGEQQLRSILVTSPWLGEGTTNVAANVAVGLAQGGLEVLLVDANLQAPFMHRVFQLPLPSRPGLRDVLVTASEGRHDLRELLGEAVQASHISGLRILTSGSTIGAPSELLASAEMRKLVELFDGQTGLTIIDAPPILSSGDASALAPLVGGVVVVFAEGRSSTDSVQTALSQLQAVGANVLGLVYNKARNLMSAQANAS